MGTNIAPSRPFHFQFTYPFSSSFPFTSYGQLNTLARANSPPFTPRSLPLALYLSAMSNRWRPRIFSYDIAYPFVPWLLLYLSATTSVLLQPMQGLSVCIVHWVYALPAPFHPQQSTTFPLTRYQFIQSFRRNRSSSTNLICVQTGNFLGQGTGIVVHGVDHAIVNETRCLQLWPRNTHNPFHLNLNSTLLGCCKDEMTNELFRKWR